MPAFRANLLLSLILAFLSGYIDTAVFVHMGGLFVAHVTGNFVLLGATVAGLESVGHGSSTVLQLISSPCSSFLPRLQAVFPGAFPKTVKLCSCSSFLPC